ncbi:MAG: cyclic nucleotide-binding domain-containing protein [Candidatus Jacksonbacteria bacterium]|jgi:CRP-like cAMP-binding protein|nr:cyclic nucleotide-binding domain-containing protein [Candidatus Jacksonbacteria bacterium]MBT6034481.1 cyclic nucleotide-binding domain-containing protein [Candidatus Jacksonbacteria bacterium]MBT6301009.1 cyclic nucleotide-binding domain-containing protein [Candidatus Jacksonbacteria bacterium]MBT6757190.1 cyclic nucleotide-binding domain-containing protein [Candidatus Jacksonbacteria bacterium]MBT6954837.1 cyclic nucleotide-binding domain-containing protein [Candidatus Jacksonbacteria bact
MVDKNIFSGLPAFSSLSNENIALLAEIAEIKTIPAHENIFTPGAKRDALGFVLQGVVEILHKHSQEAIGTLETGDALSERVLIDANDKHTETAKALTEVSLVLFPIHHLKKIQKENINLYASLQTLLIDDCTDRLYHANNKLLTIYRITTLLNQDAVSFPDMGLNLLKIILDVIRAETGIFTTFNAYTNRFHIQASVGSLHKDKDQTISPDSDPYIGTLITSPRIKALSSIDYSSRKAVWYIKKNALIAPLLSEKKITGALVLSNKLSTPEFTKNNAILLHIISQLVGGAVAEKMRLQEQQAEKEFKQVYIN